MDYHSQQLAMIYTNEIVRLHEVPLSIILDRVTQFTSMLQGKLHEVLRSQLLFSIAFHQQIDGELEKIIEMLKDMLKAYVIDFGDHRDQLLSLCDFSYNNSYHISIDMDLEHFMRGDVD